MKIIQMHNSSLSQMMGYLLVTDRGKVIAVDGGTPDDADAFKELVRRFGGHIDMWFLTHPHSDHVGALWDLIDRPTDITVGCIYYSPAEKDFMPMERNVRDDISQFERRIEKKVYPVCIMKRGDRFEIDNVEIEVFRVVNPALKNDYINNLSVVFKVTEKQTENRSFTMIFLGDLGWTCGDELLELCKSDPEKLHADAVQMAHHGQWGVEEPVYQAIQPGFSFWPTPDWLWNNAFDGQEPGTGPFRTLETRAWMEKLGATPVTSLERHTMFNTSDYSMIEL